jgi:dolichol-phosphate mannosyltransferase
MKESLVIIPTYNEIENIENMVRKVMSLPYDFHLLIIEDNSPDGTANKVLELQKEFGDRLYMIQRQGKLGLGTAYITGFKWGLEQGYQLIYEMDCDFSHNPDYLSDLRSCMIDQSADVAVGSRYIEGGGVANWPKDRIFLSKGASIYVRFILGLPVYDTTAGFVCYKRKVLETIDLEKIKFKGYAFQIQMKYAAYSLGFRIIETPIIFKDREFGVSKISSNIITEAIFGVIKMRWKSLFMSYQKA